MKRRKTRKSQVNEIWTLMIFLLFVWKENEKNSNILMKFYLLLWFRRMCTWKKADRSNITFINCWILWVFTIFKAKWNKQTKWIEFHRVRTNHSRQTNQTSSYVNLFYRWNIFFFDLSLFFHIYVHDRRLSQFSCFIIHFVFIDAGCLGLANMFFKYRNSEVKLLRKIWIYFEKII